MLKKPSVVFDLHGVIIQKSYLGILKHLIKHCYRIDLIFIILKPSFMRDVFKLLKKSRVPEQFIIELSEKHPALVSMVPVIINMMNEQYIITLTLAILETLKKDGYSLYLFSNIGEETFASLKKKFPELFLMFDGIIVTEQQDNWIQKPYPQAFKKFLNTFGLDAQECIFIDNSHTNIATALQEGFYAILFQSPKQLTYELIRMNVL